MFRHHLKNLLLLITSLMIGLYLVEFLLGLYLIKSILHYPVPPFSEQTHTTVDYAVRYHYNNISLRGNDYELTQLYDLALLGDSFMFGQGVDEDKTLQGVLERRGYRVLNISEIATNPIDYYHKLNVLNSQRMKVKNIVIGLCMGNDFQGIGDKRIEYALTYNYRSNFLDYDLYAFLKLERLRYQIRSTRFRLSEKLGKKISSQYKEEIKVHEFEHPRVFYSDWIQFFTNNNEEMMRTMRGEGQAPIVPGRLSEDEYLKKLQMDDASVENTLRIIQAIANAAQPARVYLLLIPDLYCTSGFKSKKYESYVRRLVDGVNGSIDIIDLHGMFSPDEYYHHDGHWNAKGHQVAADIISQHVLSHRK